MTNYVDIKLFYLINKGCSGPFLNSIMPVLTDIGTGQFIAFIALVLILFKKKEYRMAGLLLFAGITLTYIIVDALKIWIARPRPFMVLPDALCLLKAKDFSFPSGHSANAFMAATILSTVFKRYVSALIFILALLVGFSRIYIGVHFPSDVIGGFIIGAIVGRLLVSLGKELK